MAVAVRCHEGPCAGDVARRAPESGRDRPGVKPPRSHAGEGARAKSRKCPNPKPGREGGRGGNEEQATASPGPRTSWAPSGKRASPGPRTSWAPSGKRAIAPPGPHKGTTSGRPLGAGTRKRPARRRAPLPDAACADSVSRRALGATAPEAETGAQGPEGCGAGSSGLRGMDFQVGATETFGKQVVAVVTRHRE